MIFSFCRLQNMDHNLQSHYKIQIVNRDFLIKEKTLFLWYCELGHNFQPINKNYSDLHWEKTNSKNFPIFFVQRMTKFVERKALIVNPNPLQMHSLDGCASFWGIQINFNSTELLHDEVGNFTTWIQIFLFVCFFQLWIRLTAHTWDANKMTQSFVYCRFFKLLWLNYFCALELLFLLNSCIYRALSKQNVQHYRSWSLLNCMDSCEANSLLECLSREYSLYPPFLGFLW